MGPDHDLISRWFLHQKLVPPAKKLTLFAARGKPRWVWVLETFAVGSTRAGEACRRHGYDPDELVRM